MKRFLPFVYLLFLSFLFVSCWKKITMNINADGLPYGENSLYYYEDGHLVIPKTIHSIEFTIPDISYFLCPQGTANAGGLELSDSEDLYMLISNLNVGRYECGYGDFPVCDYADGTSAVLFREERDSIGNYRTYAYTTRPGSGYIQIDYVSPDKRRLRGRFEMTLYCDVTGRTKHITDGHFNLNLNKLHGN